MTSRVNGIACLVGVICLGILSRVVHTGWVVFDKYLGDALYAVMIYAFIGLFSRAAPLRKALISMALITGLEIFQLTMIPARLLASGYLALRVFARLLGTEFSVHDLIAYAVGIFGVYCWEVYFLARKSR